MTLECAANDTHVPPDGALRFQAALRESAPQHPDHIRVNLLPGMGHMDGSSVTIVQSEAESLKTA
jgi:hypothetical protein